MDLKTYFKSQSEIELFESQFGPHQEEHRKNNNDNADVLSFMKKSPMRLGGIDLLYDRSPDFQELLKCQAPQYFTFLSRNSEKKIKGFFSISVAQKWIHGQKVFCGYIGDFRTDLSRASAKTWRRVYAEILKAVQNDSSLNKPQYFLTAILKKNTQALKSLTSTKKMGFKYHFLQDINMINVYGAIPWFRQNAKNKTYRIQNATESDLIPLKKFMNQCEKNKLFGTIFDESCTENCNDSGHLTCKNTWAYRQLVWPHFCIENFLLIKNESGEIQACTLPWNPSFAKKMKVLRAPMALQIFFKVLSFLGFDMPSVGQNLETIYLTHLNINSDLKLNMNLNISESSVEKKRVISAFVEHVLKTHKFIHMVSFPDFDQTFSKSMKGFIFQRIGVSLFSVSVSASASVDSLQESEQSLEKKYEDLLVSGQNVSFEMGLV